MAKGLNKLTWVANLIEARVDWAKAEREAVEAGIEREYIDSIRPGSGWGWKKIDKATKALREAIEAKRELVRILNMGVMKGGRDGEK